MSSRISTSEGNMSSEISTSVGSQSPVYQKICKARNRSFQLSEPKEILFALSIVAAIVAIGTLYVAYVYQGSNPLIFQAALYVGMGAGGVLALSSLSFVIVTALKKRSDDGYKRIMKLIANELNKK